MQTVIRLKRPLEESPSDSLVLSCCKKRKVENAVGPIDSLSTILKFSRTQNSQNEDINEHIANVQNGFKNNMKEIIKQKSKRDVNIPKKLLEEAKERSKIHRYKVVNCLRSIPKDDLNTSVTILDIEKEEVGGSSSSNQNYVYDLYFTDAKIADEVDDYEISIEPTLVTYDFDDVYNVSDQESDDSNAENYYKNDYPDESDSRSFSEDDMIKALNKFRINEMSSSDEDLVNYGEPKEGYYCDHIVDDSDEDLSGIAYDKFRNAYERKSKSNDSEDDIDDYYE